MDKLYENENKTYEKKLSKKEIQEIDEVTYMDKNETILKENFDYSVLDSKEEKKEIERSKW